MANAESYRANASQLLRFAKIASEPDVAAACIDLAEGYRRLAEYVERRGEDGARASLLVLA